MHTQHNFCTQQLRYVGITVIVILFGKSCVQKVRTNSFQEVLEAVLFGGWSIPPTAHGWLLCGSPTRVSMTFILSMGKILFELTYIYQTMCEFGIFILGGSWKISSELVVPCESVGSPKLESHLGKLLRDSCASGACVKFGIRNVRRVHLTDI